MSDTDRIVAAILAAAKVSRMGERPADDYIAEYEAFLGHFKKVEADAGKARAERVEKVGEEFSQKTAENTRKAGISVRFPNLE